MLRNCTIFLRNRPSAPQKEVEVRLAAHPFSPPVPFLAVGPKKMCGSNSPKAKTILGSVFAVGEIYFGSVFAAGEK